MTVTITGIIPSISLDTFVPLPRVSVFSYELSSQISPIGCIIPNRQSAVHEAWLSHITNANIFAKYFFYLLRPRSCVCV